MGVFLQVGPPIVLVPAVDMSGSCCQDHGMTRQGNGRLVLLLLVACQAGCQRAHTVDDTDCKPVFYRSNYITMWDVPYGDHQRQVMDIHLRGSWATSDGGFNVRLEGPQPPTIVFAHGSAWYLSDKREWEHVITPFLQRGYNVVNLNYRLREGIEPAVMDVRDALEYLAINNNRFGLDLDNVVLSGVSAGGHMTMFIACAQNSGEPSISIPPGMGISGVVSIVGGGAGCYELYEMLRDHEESFWRDVADTLVDDHERAEELMERYCPIHQFDDGDPPMFIAYGRRDPFGSDSKYAEVVRGLEDAGISYQLIGYENSGHNLVQEDWEDAFMRIFRFVDLHAGRQSIIVD
ncbi:MAG: hypothetical protein CMJ32_04510 [Phycisphaerae bacterium]|nr:hypothetical protein [Phycisphaerae bacterium]